MTKEQIKLIREICQQDDGTGRPLASVLSAIFNDEIMFRNTDDFLIYDDENELIHAIKANYDNAVSGAKWPFKICTGFYGNIQFMEGLYDMSNFESAIDQLFVDTGLIDEEKKSMIMKWADSIRNHAMVPKAPGPYHTSVPHIPPKPPVPECRPDGIWHAEPIDQRTKKNIIFNLIDTAIQKYSGDAVFKKIRSAYYELSYIDNNDMAATFKNFIDTLGKNLFYASLTNDTMAAIIDPKVQASTDNFVRIAAADILPDKIGSTVNIKMYIEAYGVRVRYDFRTTKIEDPAVIEWINNTTESVDEFFNTISSDAISSSSAEDKKISVVINTTDGLDIGLVDFLTSIDGLNEVRLSANSKTYTMTIGDTASYTTFKEGVLSIMPTENGQSVNGDVVMTASNGGSLTYVFNVKYYNQNDCPVKIGDVYYNTISEACAIGGAIELLKDTIEDVVIPVGAEVNLSLGGHKITNVSGHTITNQGTLTLTGPGTVDSIIDKKAALSNTGTATLTNVTLERSEETGVNATTSGGNSYYTIDNKGTMSIGAGVVVNNAGSYSSNVENGWSNYTSGTATMTIDGATITGGLNNVKNDEGGNLTIESGSFTGAGQNAVMNWNVAVINGGTFDSTTPTLQNGAYNGSAGDLTITNGTFDTDGNSNIMEYAGYESDNIKISGGSFSHTVDSKYVVSGCEVVEVEGRFVVQTVSDEEKAEAAINDFIDSIENENVTIEADPDTQNTYNVTTSTGSLTETGIFDTIVAQDGVTSVVVTDGEATETYTVGTSDLSTFKAAVDAMVPNANVDDPVTLTVTVNF